MVFYIQIDVEGLAFPYWDSIAPSFIYCTQFRLQRYSVVTLVHGINLFSPQDRVSLCSSGWSRTIFIFQIDLKFWDLPTSAPKFGIKCKHHHAWQNRLLRGSRLNTTLGSFLQPSPGGKAGSLCSSPSASCADMVVDSAFCGKVQEEHCCPQLLESEWSEKHSGLAPGATICSPQYWLSDISELSHLKILSWSFLQGWEEAQFSQEQAEKI